MTGKKWAPAGSLTLDLVSKQDHVCFVCGSKIPAGTPHQYRSMCVYHACSKCPYPKDKGNYQ